MGRANRQDLYLQVSGDVVGLRQAMTTGRTLVNEFGSGAINVIEEVEKEFAKLGTSGLPNLKQVEASYTASFKRIGDQARAVLNAPTPQAAVQIIDAGAARQAAENATAQAAGLRLVAEAASRADLATGGTDKATRAYAVAAATAAVGAEEEARALREQAVVLGNVEQQLGLTGAAQRRNVAVNGQSRAGYQQLSFQLGDVATQYASGTAASIIFAQQSGQVIQAIGLISGQAKGFIGFLGGPYGIALGAAAVALTPWVSKLLEGDDALAKETHSLEENAAKTAVSEQAKKAFGNTEAGVAEDVRQLTEEIKKQNEALLTNAERLNYRAKQDQEKLQKLRPAAVERVADAKRDVDAARISELAGATGALAAAQARLATEEAALLNLDRNIAAATAARVASQKDLSQESAKRATDPIAAINYKYEGAGGLIAQAKKQATAEEAINGVLRRRLVLLDEQQKAEVAAAQKRIAAAKSTGTANQQFGREIDVAQAKAIAESIGGRVTSGLRSTAKQAQLYRDKLAGRHDGPVAAPGTSAHETGNAIDIAYGVGISVKSIRDAFAKEGVKLRKILNEPGQKVFHVEFGKAGPSAATTARKAEAEADTKVRNADEYASLLSRAKDDQLRLERSRITDIAAAADLDAAAVAAARADLDRAAQKGVELEKWTQAEADAVKAINKSNAALETQAIRDRARVALAQQQFEIDQAALDDKISALRIDADLATTAEARRAIARRILKLEQDEVEAALRRQLSDPNTRPAERATAQRRLGELPGIYAKKGQQLDKQDAGPLAAYRDRLEQSVGDIDEALQDVGVHGLNTLQEGLEGVLNGTVSVGSAFKKMANSIIADLIRIAIQKAILGVATSFLGLKDGGPIPGFAGGGSPGGLITGPGTGRSDSILAILGGGRGAIRVSTDEFIVNAAATREHLPLLQALNSGRLPGFADGGSIAPTMRLPSVSIPRLPSPGAMRRGGGAFSLSMPVTISADGADSAALGRLTSEVSQLRAELPGQVLGLVGDAMERGYIN